MKLQQVITFDVASNSNAGIKKKKKLTIKNVAPKSTAFSFTSKSIGTAKKKTNNNLLQIS